MSFQSGRSTFTNRGRPPGLRGKEIGLYYRDKARQRKAEGTEPQRILLGPSVSVPTDILAHVKECLEKFKQNDEDARVCYEFEKKFHHLLSVNFDEFIEQAKSETDCLLHNDNMNERLKSDLLAKQSTDNYQILWEQRQRLPAIKQQEEILEAIQKSQVLLIVGSTGSGKTTQVPQLLLDESIFSNLGTQCNIVCTQPRRISAITVAERVAYERCEKLGTSVGYQIRLDSKMPRECGSILYCTTGILLQKMQSDPLMNDVSAVILDEVHERNVETDLLMGLLKKVLPHRPTLKVILMSATISEEDFSKYFNNCPILRIEGTLFPVKVQYMEDILQETGYTKFENSPQNATKHGRHKKQRLDAARNREYNFFMEPYLRQIRDKYDSNVIQALRCSDAEGCENLQFMEHLIFYICEHKPPGAILVFLPGYDKITKLHSLLQKPTQKNGQQLCRKIQVYALHSMMPTVEQKSVFLPPPNGMRKVILSTNIAETSVTIDDVVYVINSGRIKMTSYNIEANIQTLEENWVTKANSQQRKGRAGRVQPGICYNLFTKARERTMDNTPTPEILRSKMESIILNLKLLHIKDAFEFLTTLMNVPNINAVENGIKLLKRIEALDPNGVITPLGMHLARLPIDPQMAKMILMGALFRCMDPITSAAAGLAYKSPFYTPLGEEKKVDAVKRDLAADSKSDHLLIHNTILSFRDHGAERHFCYKNFLSLSTLYQLERMKKQFVDLMEQASFIEKAPLDSSNMNSKNVPLLRAIIAAGLYPNMAHLRKVRLIRNQTHAIHHMSTPEERRINFHPSSVNSGEPSFDSNYFVYFQKQKSSALYLLDSTMVFPMALLIFGDGVQAAVTPDRVSYITVGNSYNFKCEPETAEVILSLRSNLRLLMQKKALYPSPVLRNSNDEYLIKAIQLLLSLDDGYEYEDDYLTSDEEM